MSLIPEERQPFYIPGRFGGCLLVHGFTGSPYEMRPIGDALRSLACTVHSPLLPGHGFLPMDVHGTTWRDWVASAEEGLLRLRQETQGPLVVVGHSMGGMIALDLASRYPVAGVVALAPAVKVSYPMAHLSHLVRWFRPFWPLRRGIGPEGIIPVAAVSSLLWYIRRVRRRLERVTAPSLIVQGEADETVHPHGARWLAGMLRRSAAVELSFFPASPHVLMYGPESDSISRQVVDFVRQILGKISNV